MAKSLRDTWKGYKAAMAKLDMSKVPKPMQAGLQKKVDEVLKTFDAGFGPTLDKFEAAEAKKDAKEMKVQQAKLHDIIKTYKANAARVLETDNNTVSTQLDKFKKEIDGRVS